MITLNRILLLLCVISIGQCYAQDTYFTTWYSADSNHLPQNTVKHIVKDTYGYIWLATESGLVQFDGENFKTFNAKNVKGMRSERMNQFGGFVHKDSLVVTNELRQYFLIQERKIVEDTTKRKPLVFIPPVHYSTDYVIILSPLHYYSKKEYFKVSSQGNNYIIGNDSIRAFTKGVKHKDSFFYDLKKHTQFFSLSGKLYHLENKNGYVEFSGNEILHKKFDPSITKQCIIYTNEPEGQVFLASGKNLYHLEEKEGTLHTTLIYNNYNKEDNIETICFDKKNHVIYLGSLNKGLLVVKKQVFKELTSPLKHHIGVDNVYYGVSAYGDNQIIAATGDIFENGKHLININLEANSDKFSIHVDENKDVWVAKHRYIHCYRKSSNYTKHDTWLLHRRVSTITMGKNGILWIGCSFPYNMKEPGALYYIDLKQKEYNPVLYMDLENGAKSILNPIDDELWVGSRDKMLKIKISTKEIEEISEFKNCYIRDMYSTGPNEFWAASYTKGLFLYKDGKVTNFPPDKNKYILTSHCIIEDKDGFFWVTTNKGLFRVNKQDLHDYASGKKEGVYYYHYNKNAGFSTNEFNGGCDPCGVYLNNENIFFPSMRGIVYFNPNEVATNYPENDIFIDDAIIDNTAVTTNNLSLNRNFGRATFIISSPFNGDVNNQCLEIKLAGPVMHKWSKVTKNKVSYSTLPPGEYELTARKLPGFNSNYVYKTITFTVKPAFWQTTWFAILFIIACAFIIVLIFKIRLRYIRYKNEILEQQVSVRTIQLKSTIETLRATKDDLSVQNENHKKLIKNITHDIKSPLKFMEITGRYVYNNLDKKDISFKEDIESIYTSSSQLYHFVDNFLEYTKQADDKSISVPHPLHKLAEEKIKFFKNIAQSRNISLVNNITPAITTQLNKHLLSIVLHNLLDNAIKNTSEGNVTFSATITENDAITLSIKDTGKGISATQLARYNDLINNIDTELEKDQNGIGLLIIKELLVIMTVTMKIDSQENIGTEITLTLPQ
ncbi:MAG: hypothetical protein BM557_06115 [Flavobacterium sp. MedPE-SWcel]|uniref:sensor histidine kinase n=1 Tax=uncultured Flavobacterium sp. TaxID=165435 RepID=UPI000919396B|nr:sensor histidine kinase [uncultured Flavobacterium sp.]OIQ19276.1 MAG: hypothetical protein BM557_06115 [Flavobacterium sp. MedPE-SWcel]